MKQQKSILLDELIHNQLKKYCDEKGLKLKQFVERLIKDETTKEKSRD